jgi:hypothetical protein
MNQLYHCATQIRTVVLIEIQVYGYGVPNLLENTHIHSISYSHDKNYLFEESSRVKEFNATLDNN